MWKIVLKKIVSNLFKQKRGSCVLGGPYEGYMGMKPIEPGIRALSIND